MDISMQDWGIFFALGASLLVGLVVGFERGWTTRNEEEGSRPAGLRTFLLLGLFGGVAGWLSHSQENGWIIALGVVAISILFSLSYLLQWRRNRSLGQTTSVAALLVFLLGALAAMGEEAAAVAGAVITALLLRFKAELHERLARIEARAVSAALQLAALTAVILPLLPNDGMGPWDALNPFRIWLMVILIAAIGFTGYVLMRLLPPRHGLAAMAGLGSLASSTALSLTFARYARNSREAASVLAAGVSIAAGVMILRLLILFTIAGGSFDVSFGLAMGAMAAACFLSALVGFLLSRNSHAGINPDAVEPFQLGLALRFAAIYALVLLLGAWLTQTYGARSLLWLSAVSALTDVDAITLTLAEYRHSLPHATLLSGLIIAVTVNNAVKAGLAFFFGTPAFAARVGAYLALPTIAGLIFLQGFID